MAIISGDPIGQKAVDYVKRIQNLKADAASHKRQCAEECKVISDDIKLVLREVKDADIPLASFKAVLRALDLQAKRDACRDGLRDIDLISKFDVIERAVQLSLDLKEAA